LVVSISDFGLNKNVKKHKKHIQKKLFSGAAPTFAAELAHRPILGELDHSSKINDYVDSRIGWGRTGFDHVNTPEAACRG